MLKLAKLLLVTLFVVQITNALPTPDNSPMPFTDVGQLIRNAGETYVDFFGFATEKYTELFEKILEKSHADAESDHELQSALMPFVNYVSKMHDMHDMHDKSRETLQMLFEECTTLADKYDRGVPVDASDADHKIAKYMNDVHAMKTKFDILMKYINSLQQFANNVRKYLNTLPEDEHEHQKKLRMWYINWQRNHDWEKKNDLMLSFFEIFDDEKDDRTKLAEKVIRNIMTFLNAVVMERKDFFAKVVKGIESEITDPAEDVKFTLKNLKGYVDRAGKMNDLKGQDQTVEMIRLYAAAEEVKMRYKGTDISDGEKKIAEIMDKNGGMDIEVREVLLTFGLSEEIVKDVEEYLDTRHEKSKEKEENLRNWFEHVQDETDLHRKTNMLFGLLEVLGQIN